MKLDGATIFRYGVSRRGLKKVEAGPAIVAEPATAPSEAPSNIPDSKPYAWILSPSIDMLFSCGGLVWIFFAIHYFVLGPQNEDFGAQALVTMVIIATHLLSETHNVATLDRIYTDKDQKRFEYFKTSLAAICGTLAIFGIAFPSIASIFTKIYLLWVAQHFAAQTYGLTLLYCYKRNYPLGEFGKNSLRLIMHAITLFAIVRQFTFEDWGGGKFLGLEIPFWGPLPAPIFEGCAIALLCACIVFIAVIAKIAIFQRRIFPVPAMLMTLTGVLIWIFGKEATGTLWLYVPAFYHGSQYLVVSTAYHLKEKGLPEGVPTNKIASVLCKPDAIKYFTNLLLIGVAVYVGIPHILQQVGCSYDVVFASIFCAINFHHFLTDGAIWKLRDKRNRDILIA